MLRDVGAGWGKAVGSEMANESMLVGRSAIKGILPAGPPTNAGPKRQYSVPPSHRDFDSPSQSLMAGWTSFHFILLPNYKGSLASHSRACQTSLSWPKKSTCSCFNTPPSLDLNIKRIIFSFIIFLLGLKFVFELSKIRWALFSEQPSYLPGTPDLAAVS